MIIVVIIVIIIVIIISIIIIIIIIIIINLSQCKPINTYLRCADTAPTPTT